MILNGTVWACVHTARHPEESYVRHFHCKLGFPVQKYDFEWNGVGLIFFNKCVHTGRHPNILLHRDIHCNLGFPVKNMILNGTVWAWSFFNKCVHTARHPEGFYVWHFHRNLGFPVKIWFWMERCAPDLFLTSVYTPGDTLKNFK
jgi:hypothetical protein